MRSLLRQLEEAKRSDAWFKDASVRAEKLVDDLLERLQKKFPDRQLTRGPWTEVNDKGVANLIIREQGREDDVVYNTDPLTREMSAFLGGGVRVRMHYEQRQDGGFQEYDIDVDLAKKKGK